MKHNSTEAETGLSESGATRLDVVISFVLMTASTVPIALTGVPIHIAALAGMAITFTLNIGLWWARGIAPMDYLWHGFDTADAKPILSGGETDE